MNNRRIQIDLDFKFFAKGDSSADGDTVSFIINPVNQYSMYIDFILG